MANRIPLVVVSSEQLVKELPAVDDLDLANSSIRNVATANVGNINVTSLIVSTANATTVNTSTLSIIGTTTIEEILEKANVSATALGANLTIDVLSGAVTYLTSNATANSTINFRGNSTVSLDTFMTTGQSLSTAILITNGATPYVIANIQVDGTSLTPKWSGGSAPTASANSVDAYAFSIIKTGSAAYTVLGSKTQFA